MKFKRLVIILLCIYGLIIILNILQPTQLIRVITLSGTARVKKYLVINTPQLTLGASSPNLSTEGTFPILLFSSVITEDAYVAFHIPENWAIGTDLEIGIYWTPTDGNSGNVSWEFDWEAIAPEANETLGTGITHVEIKDVTQNLDNELLETPYGIISGASIATDDTIGMHFYRDHDDSFDTYGSDAGVVHFEVIYIVDN